MTETEKQEIIDEVLAAIRANAKTIAGLTEATEIADNDYLELDSGRKVAFSVISDAVKQLTDDDLASLNQVVKSTTLTSVAIAATATGATLTITSDAAKVSCAIPAATTLTAGLMTATQANALNNATSTAIAAAGQASTNAAVITDLQTQANETATNAATALTTANAAAEDVADHTAAVSIHPIAGVARNVYDEASDDYDPTATGITYLQDEQKFVNVVADDTESAPSYTVEQGDYGTSGVRRNLLRRTNCGAGYGDTTSSGFYRNGWMAYGYNASTGVNAVAITQGEITQLGTNTRVGQYARFDHMQGVTCTSEYIAFPIRPDIIKAGEKYTVSLVVVDGRNASYNDLTAYPLLSFKAQICDNTAANPLTDQVATTLVQRVTNGTRITATLTATADGSADGSQYLMLYLASECLDKWEFFSVFDLKLERGETATAWCCAPEDVQPTTTEAITDSLYNVDLLAFDKEKPSGGVTTQGAANQLWRANTAKIYRHGYDLWQIHTDYTPYRFATLDDIAAEATDRAAADTALQGSLDRVDRGLAYYWDGVEDGENVIALCVKQTDTAMLVDGTTKAMSGYFVSGEIQLVAGNIYLVPATKGFDPSVAVIARKVTERSIVPITWSYVYDSNGEITEATNDYEIGKAYRQEADGTWTDDLEGENIAALPMTRVVEADSYVPLFRNSGGVPASGYWAIVAPETCRAVVCNTTANAESDRVYVAAYGAIRSLAINKAQKSDVVAIESRVAANEERLTEQQLERYQDIADSATARLTAAGKAMLYGYIPGADGGKRGHWQDVAFGSDEAKSCTMICGGYTNKATSMQSKFYQHTLLRYADVTGFDVSMATTFVYCFAHDADLEVIDLRGWDTSKVVDFSYVFWDCPKLKEIKGIADIDTSQVTSMAYLFHSCKLLQTLDVSNWDTSEVTNMSNLFSGCSSLQALDLSNWDTGALTDGNAMFGSLTLRHITLGWAFFKTTLSSRFDQVSQLGRNEDGTSNGWVDHLADAAPWILADDADDLATQVAAFTAQYGSYKADSSLTALEAFKAAIEDAGQHYLEDYTARTIQLPTALTNLRNTDSSVMAALKLLNSKGFTISGITL